MKKIMITLVAVMSLFLCVSTGVLAEDLSSDLVYNGILFCGLRDSTGLFFANSNGQQLLIAFNDSENDTKVVNALSNPDETAWNQYGDAVDPSADDAVVIFNEETNTLTLSDYHYKGIGCFWEKDLTGGYTGIYADGLGELTIWVEEDSSIDIDGIDQPYSQANSMGILADGQTSINIVGVSGAELDVQHGPTGIGYTKAGAIMVYGGLSVSTDGEGTPFKLVCRGADAEEDNRGFEFYGLYAQTEDINLTNIVLDIESASKNGGGFSIGIAAGGTTNGVNLTGCTGTIKGGDGIAASEAVHCGSLNAYVPGEDNHLTIQNSTLELIAGASTSSSYALTVLHKAVIDGSILTLETDPNAKMSYGLIQSGEETAELVIKNQSDITSYGKNGALVYDVIGKKDLDFSEYGENLKVEAGLNEAEAVLLDNPQDCVGYDVPYVHIYAQGETPDPTPEPDQPVNPTTGIGDSRTEGTICALVLFALAAGFVFCYLKRQSYRK